MSDKIVIKYFGLDGLGILARATCVIGKLNWEDKVVTDAEWAIMKPQTKYKCLPEMQRGELVLGNSVAILKYLGREAKMYPDNIAHYIDELIESFDDINARIAPLHYLGARAGIKLHFTPEERLQYKKNSREGLIKNILGVHEKSLEQSKTGYFLSEKTPTIADIFLAYSTWPLIANKYFEDFEDFKSEYPCIASIKEKIESLPCMIEYREKNPNQEATEKFLKWLRAEFC